MIFKQAQIDLQDWEVLDEIASARQQLTGELRVPRRWTGLMRRNALARAIRGSNSIEGYHVDLDDAVAVIEDEAPLSTDARTWKEIRGYWQALGYVLATADDPVAGLNEETLRALHFMMLSHDLSKSPGRYRDREIFVHDDATEEVVYVAPDPELIPGLMSELVTNLEAIREPFLDAAMAHLNLVMIHPFRDGNGRMARCLQTLILGRGGVPEPEFSSIEEWLGANTDDYYRVLAVVGGGAWHPERDTALWVKFCLRAHHMQAQTIQRRAELASRLGGHILSLIEARGLHERHFDPLYDAALGLKVRRARYVQASQVDERTASRDLVTLVKEGLLHPRGQTRGRFYTANDDLRRCATEARRDLPRVRDPYPGFVDHLRRAAESVARGSAI